MWQTKIGGERKKSVPHTGGARKWERFSTKRILFANLSNLQEFAFSYMCFYPIFPLSFLYMRCLTSLFPHLIASFLLAHSVSLAECAVSCFIFLSLSAFCFLFFLCFFMLAIIESHLLEIKKREYDYTFLFLSRFEFNDRTLDGKS